MSVTRTQLNEAIRKNWHEQKVMLQTDEDLSKLKKEIRTDRTYQYTIEARWGASTTDSFFRPNPIIRALRNS